MTPLERLPFPLLEWYRDNARRLPWRDDPTAYHVWVSEIMLQQTRVAAVLGYYARFLDAAPDVAALAALPEEKLMKLWEGLGYYSRARNLQAAARQIVEKHGGVFPADSESVRARPGVGTTPPGPSAPSPLDRPSPRWTGTSCGWWLGFVGTRETSRLPRPKSGWRRPCAPSSLRTPPGPSPRR